MLYLTIMVVIYILLGASLLSNIFLFYYFIRISRLSIFKNKTTLDKAFTDIHKILQSQSHEIETHKKEHKIIHDRINFAFSNIKMVKFTTLPGDIAKNSFSLIIVNDYKDGVIITSLHSIKFTRITIKHVNAGKSTEELLPEENNLLMSIL